MKPKIAKDGWPIEWEMLKADDLCRGSYKMGERCCSSGWMRMNLYGGARSSDHKQWAMGDIDRELLFARYFMQAARYLKSVVTTYSTLPGVNDDLDNSLALIARVNNLAAALAGYVVNNDEAKTLKKMRAK